jgi:dihydrolipoamide dehydrogenase
MAQPMHKQNTVSAVSLRTTIDIYYFIPFSSIRFINQIIGIHSRLLQVLFISLRRNSMFDLMVIGGGPAGYYAAEKTGEAGLSTLLIEKDRLGGVCLNEGCIPSKTLLYSAKLFTQAKNSEAFGVSVSGASFDLSRAMARKEKIITSLRNGIAFTLKKNNVTLRLGAARLLEKGEGFRAEVNGEILEGKRLIVCTGSEAIRLSIPGADLPHVLTNTEILSLKALPKNLVVIGGGVVGLEMAMFFAETGCSITVIELLPTIGGSLDAEIGLLLKRELEKKGVKFLLQSRAIAISEHAVTYEGNGASAEVEADIVLMSIGRRPKTGGLGLENLGAGIERGALITDGKCRTNIQGIWAAGDVNGKSMLAHTAYREAQVCVDDILGRDTFVNYDAIPGVIYTHPEAAWVGMTKEEAENRGFSCACAKLPLAYNGRYNAETEGGRGMCKVVVDSQSRRLLGVHIIGAACSEMIFGATAMIEQKMTVEDIGKVVFPHPSVSEIIKDTILQV